VTSLRIEWPSGTVQQLANVAANQILTIVEPRRPVLTATAPGAGTLSADPNRTYVIYFSEDLGNWTALPSVTTDAQGTTTWTDPGATGSSKRFYKAQGQ